MWYFIGTARPCISATPKTPHYPLYMEENKECGLISVLIKENKDLIKENKDHCLCRVFSVKYIPIQTPACTFEVTCHKVVYLNMS